MEQKRCRTNAVEFGNLKRIRSSRNVRAVVVKRRRKNRMESLLQQATFSGSAHGQWRNATNFAPERACRRGYATLDLTGATRIVDLMRVNTNCQNGKRKHVPIRRGAVKLRDAAEAKIGLQKLRKCKVWMHEDVDDLSWDGNRER